MVRSCLCKGLGFVPSAPMGLTTSWAQEMRLVTCSETLTHTNSQNVKTGKIRSMLTMRAFHPCGDCILLRTLVPLPLKPSTQKAAAWFVCLHYALPWLSSVCVPSVMACRVRQLDSESDKYKIWRKDRENTQENQV